MEKRRSLETIERIMGVNNEQQVGESVSKAFEYYFSTVPQFMAILETMGYGCYTEDDNVILKRNGVVQDKVKIALVESKCRKDTQDKKRIAQLRAILKKYRDMSANRKELQDAMKSKFGVNLFFLGSKDSPHGYLIIDNHSRFVFKGSDVMKIKELLQFQSKEERFSQMDTFVNQMLKDNINLTTKELNRLLLRQFGSRLLNGEIIYGGVSHRLSDHILQTLRSNDRRAWIQSFYPTAEQERAILCKIGKYSHPERITIQSTPGSNVNKTVEQLRHIFDTTPDESLRSKFREDGFLITNVDGQVYCIDFPNHAIVNMNAHGLDVTRLFVNPHSQDQTLQTSSHQISGHGVGDKVDKLVNQRGGSDDNNREWEVGGHGSEVDDERSLKR